MSIYRTLEVVPCSGALSAEILGVDLSGELSEDTFEEMHRAFVDHQVIFFRSQHLTPEQHKQFGRRFGPLIVHPYLEGLPGHPEIMLIKKGSVAFWDNRCTIGSVTAEC